MKLLPETDSSETFFVFQLALLQMKIMLLLAKGQGGGVVGDCVIGGIIMTEDVGSTGGV